jgi:hypothetical protein
MSSIFGPEIEGDDVDSRQLSYADYKLGDFISFKKSPQAQISYGIISEILPDNAEGKTYNIICYDTGRTDDSVTSNPTTESALRENISPYSQTIPVYLRHSDNQFRGLEEVTKIPDIQVPEAIREQLQGAFNTRPGRFVTPEPSPFNTRDNSTNSTNSSNSRSRNSSSGSGSGSGGKRYRNKKNKTKRRNKKTKRRRNRKSKRR